MRIELTSLLIITLHEVIPQFSSPVELLWFGLVGFYGIPTIVGYLMPNHFYRCTLNIYHLVWLDFMAYQPL